MELRDHGKYGIEPQFLDPTEIRISHMFRLGVDPTRTARELAIAWAEAERKAIEADGLLLGEESSRGAARG